MKDTQGGISEAGLAERGNTQVINWSNRAQDLSGKLFSYLENLEHSGGEKITAGFLSFQSWTESYFKFQSPNQLKPLLRINTDMSLTNAYLINRHSFIAKLLGSSIWGSWEKRILSLRSTRPAQWTLHQALSQNNWNKQTNQASLSYTGEWVISKWELSPEKLWLNLSQHVEFLLSSKTAGSSLFYLDWSFSSTASKYWDKGHVSGMWPNKTSKLQ